MEKLQQLRSIVVNISKVIGIILCSYYIIKYSDYNIGWNFNVWLLSSYMSTLNSILATFGTFILVIPLSMLLTSFLIDNKYLNISCVIFSVSGGIVSILISIAKGTLSEFSNFRLFIIYHTLTLEEKRTIFIQEFKIAMVELTEESVKKLEYLQSRLSDTYMAVYDNALIKLPAKDVKSYAINTVNDLLLKYETKQPGLIKRILYPIGNFIYNNPQEIAVGIFVVIACVLGYKGYYYFFGGVPEIDKKIVENVQGVANLGKEGAVALSAGSKIDEGMVNVTRAIVNDVIGPMSETITDNTKDIAILGALFSKIQQDVVDLSAGLNSTLTALGKLISKVKALEAKDIINAS